MRTKPEILTASRKRRIASGAGVSVQEVNQLLNQFEQAQKMMKMVAKGNLAKMMRGMRHIIHRAIEYFFVCPRWLCKSGKLPNKLERRSADLVIRRWW